MALDASADPVDVARRLQRAHAEIVEHDGGRVPADVRAVVLESWRRTRDAGLRPDAQEPVVLIDEARIDDARREHPLAATRAAIHQAVGRIAQDAGHLLVVTDAGGTLLWAEGHSAIKDAAVHLGFFEGACWSEGAVGTNAIGTAIAIDHPVQILSGEHFVRTHHPWVCSGAPVHDPETGAILGVIDLSGPLRTAHPMILGFVATAARMAEHLLAERMHRADHALHEALLADLERRGHGRAAVVSPSGRVVASWPAGWLAGRIDPPAAAARVTLPDGTVADCEPVGEAGVLLRAVAASAPTALGAPDPGAAAGGRLTLLGDRPRLTWPGGAVDLGGRHAEILALLAAHPAGLTAEALADALHGPGGNAVTARAEVSRLRKLVGPRVRTRPYRLADDVDVDLVRVRSALADGHPAAALRAYAGPLLPRSTAPGVVAVRAVLDAELHAVVADATDPAVLLAWTASPDGRDDVAAHDRLLAALPPDDPRRAVVARRRAAL